MTTIRFEQSYLLTNEILERAPEAMADKVAELAGQLVTEAVKTGRIDFSQPLFFPSPRLEEELHLDAVRVTMQLLAEERHDPSPIIAQVIQRPTFERPGDGVPVSSIRTLPLTRGR